MSFTENNLILVNVAAETWVGQRKDTAGVNVAGAAFTVLDLGSGVYHWTGEFTDGFRGYVVFTSSPSGLVVQSSISPISAIAADPDLGDGDTEVNHDTPTADSLTYSISGIGVDNADVFAYLKADYDAGVYTRRGRTQTDADGHWVNPLRLNSGLVYTIRFEVPGVYGPDTQEVTVP